MGHTNKIEEMPSFNWRGVEQMSFENVERILSEKAAALAATIPSCTYPSWERAYADLDAIHHRGESYFIGRTYLLHTILMEVEGHGIYYDFLLQRSHDGWRPLCAIYLEGEDSPCQVDVEYKEEGKESEENEEEYVEYEGRCSLCKTDSVRDCSLCGIGICDGCSFGKTHCKWCIMENMEF